jgi:hypothetical protein
LAHVFRKTSFPRASLIAAISANLMAAFFFDLLDFWPQDSVTFIRLPHVIPGPAESGRRILKLVVRR